MTHRLRSLASLPVLALLSALVLLAGACSTNSGTALTTTTVPPPVLPAEHRGADGLGDPPFPSLGNGGYDVEHYTLDLVYDPEETELDGTATIVAVTTQILSAFSLDLRGLSPSNVEVNGLPAEFFLRGDKLFVIPEAVLPETVRFSVDVAYQGVLLPKTSVASEDPVGWFPFDGGAFTRNGVDGASAWFPANDHPSDKATYEISVTTPKEYVMTSNGSPVQASASRSTYRWVSPAPMASHLTNVFLGSGQPVRRPGIPEILDSVPDGQVGDFETNLASTPLMIDWYAGVLGVFPFSVYGTSILPPEAPDLGAASPGQTRSIVDHDEGTSQRLVAQLVASQWLGASVGLASWEDVWWTRGWAVYAGWMWDAQLSDDPLVKFERTVTSAYAQLESDPSSVVIGRPSAAQFEAPEISVRGALAYHAMRAALGDPVFWAGLRTFQDRFRHSVATPEDLVSTMEEVSGVPLQGIIDAWVYSVPLPPLVLRYVPPPPPPPEA